MPKKKKRSKGITVTVKQAPWLVEWERWARSVRRKALSTLAQIGCGAVLLLLMLVGSWLLDKLV